MMGEDMRENAPDKNASGGLYRRVKVSPQVVERVILVLFAVLIVLFIVGIAKGGYTVTFNACGGSDAPAQKLEFGRLVAEPDPPTRQGYAFAGWYADEAHTRLWDFAGQTVSGDVTLYAGWAPAQ